MDKAAVFGTADGGPIPFRGAKEQLSPTMIKLVFRFSFLLLLFITASLVFGEMLLRYCCSKDSRALHIYTSDALLGYKLIPNLDTVYKQSEYTIGIHTDSYGLRNDSTVYASDSSLLKILGIGDSFMFGMGVEQNKTFLSHLERIFQAESKPVIAINAGVPGYGTIQEFLTATRLVPLFKPHVVIFSYFIGNDMSENYSFAHHMYSYRDTDAGTVKITNNATFRDRLGSFLNSLLSFRSFIQLSKKNEKIDAIVQSLFNNQTLQIDYTQFDMRPSEGTHSSWLLTQTPLIETATYLRKRSIPFIVVIIPSSVQIANSEMEVKNTFAIAQIAKYDLLRPNNLLNKLAKEENFILIDTTEILKQNPHGYFFALDGHLTPSGHKIVGDVIYTRLKGLKIF